MHLISRSSYSSWSPYWRSLSRLCQRWNEMVPATASVTPMSLSWCPTATRQGRRRQDISWPRDLPSRSYLKFRSSRRVSWSPKKVSWPPWSANRLAQFQHSKSTTNVVMNFETQSRETKMEINNCSDFNVWAIKMKLCAWPKPFNFRFPLKARTMTYYGDLIGELAEIDSLPAINVSYVADQCSV